MSKKNVEAIYPLSPLQQGMLFHSLLAPGTGVYLAQIRQTIHGDLRPDAFRRAWQGVIERHPVLRTAFVWDNLENPLQVVRLHADLPWEDLDWQEVPEAERREKLSALASADLGRDFDLGQAPLSRFILVRTAPDSWHFIWTHHHLVMDGWSMPMVRQEVGLLYEAFVSGREPQLPPRRPFRDYITWLQKNDLQKAETFWRALVGDFTAPTPFPVVRPMPQGEIRAEDYRIDKLHVDAALTESLDALGRRLRVTQSTIMQGVWALLLSRYSGEHDVLFGTTVSGRPPEMSGVDQMIGPFINTLPVRIDVRPAESAGAFLQRLQLRQVEFRQFEHSPLLSVQGWSGVPRGQSLFETIIAYQNFPADAARSAATPGRERPVRMKSAGSFERTNYPISIAVHPGSELVVQFMYERPRFEDGAIERMMGHFHELLRQVAEAPETAVVALRMLTGQEREAIVAWNRTDLPLPSERPVHELFEAHAARTPDHPAVSFAGRSLSYGGLNTRANRLARYLTRLGAAPERLIGVFMEKSVDTIVVLLGIMKAGAAYTPLDPAYPPGRIASIVEDAAPVLIVTLSALRNRIPEIGATIVCLDTESSAIAKEDGGDVRHPVHPDNLAYVIFTSGSTGRPKGVLVPHRGLTNLAVAQTAIQGIRADDRMLQFASLNFDASVSEIVMPLSVGATLVLGSREDLTPGPPLESFLERERVSGMTMSPSALAVFGTTRFPALRNLIVAGEACTADLLDPWAVNAQFFNAYGPTETTVCATMGRLYPGDVVTIGRPLANMQVHLLDRDLLPVPVGVPGEIYIGGIGVARGYLDRPDLTAAAFIPDPSAGGGRRMYRSGDLGRFRPDGTIEFLGRVDHQVKVRGFRIELGEIEARLAAHESIRDAVVLARQDTPGDPRLVAYVVASAPLTAAELKPFLARTLPDYMIPSAFVMMESLPVTPNGKVDRKALPAPDAGVRESAFVAPSTPTEEALAAVWSKLLRVPQVGAEDSFFQLGGHSLLATQMVSRVRTQMTVELPLRQVFEAPTLRAVAAAIDKIREGVIASADEEELAKLLDELEKLPD